ncbi:MAG TPA: hypothetical protein VEU33_49570, partial [Archangium sp.]|nr:hypothetical protein [Archangium sp.]
MRSHGFRLEEGRTFPTSQENEFNFIFPVFSHAQGLLGFPAGPGILFLIACRPAAMDFLTRLHPREEWEHLAFEIHEEPLGTGTLAGRRGD